MIYWFCRTGSLWATEELGNDDSMTRDGEIPAIFNPKRVRTPSVVVTGDSSTNGPYSNNSTGGAGASSSTAVAPGSSAQNGGSGSGAAGSCGFSNVLTSSNPQITHQDSISSSQQDPNEVVIIPADTPTSAPGSHNAAHHFGGGDSSDTQTEQQQANGHGEESELRFRKLQACKESCCSELARKVGKLMNHSLNFNAMRSMSLQMYFGVCVTILMTASWVGATHCIKYMYKYRAPYDDLLNDDQDTSSSRADLSTELEDILAISDSSLHHVEDATEMFNIPPRQPVYFSAPFFAAWFFTNFSLLFFPIYLLGLVSTRKCEKLSDILGDVLRGFRERGFTVGELDLVVRHLWKLPFDWLLVRRSLSQSLPLLLHFVAGHHLPVHPVPARPLRHGCPGPVRHQRGMRVPAILGDPARAVRGR